MIVSVSIFNADWATLKALNDSRVSVYSPTYSPVVSIKTSVLPATSVRETKLREVVYLMLIASSLPISQYELMFSMVIVWLSP